MNFTNSIGRHISKLIERFTSPEGFHKREEILSTCHRLIQDVQNRFILCEDELFLSRLVKVLTRDDFLYEGAQKILLCLVSQPKGNDLNSEVLQRINKVREVVAKVSQDWIIQEIRRTEFNSRYIRNVEILRCFMLSQNVRYGLFDKGLAYYVLQRLANEINIDSTTDAALRKLILSFGEDVTLHVSLSQMVLENYKKFLMLSAITVKPLDMNYTFPSSIFQAKDVDVDEDEIGEVVEEVLGEVVIEDLTLSNLLLCSSLSLPVSTLTDPPSPH
eukprot:TRINITY_DN5113_c0_g1_i8.p1 TRINITY_DN5113_c0_g1~~TRINITY_DN5113_c0_g1_i8.p1  ORF type:complete len:274 (-),score=60.32 TRINITY_DN5113_c0_g1_i8:145-966(-)